VVNALSAVYTNATSVSVCRLQFGAMLLSKKLAVVLLDNNVVASS